MCPLFEERVCGRVSVEISIKDPEDVANARYENFFSISEADQLTDCLDFRADEGFFALRPLKKLRKSYYVEVGTTRVRYPIPFFNKHFFQEGILVVLRMENGESYKYFYEYKEGLKEPLEPIRVEKLEEQF